MSIQVSTTTAEPTVEPFKVFIRVRPLNEKEKQHFERNAPVNKSNQRQSHQQSLKNILVAEDNLLFVVDPDTFEFNTRKEKSFVFDNIFTEHHSNFNIFESVIRNMIDNVMRGYNATALAYGVTGTGKTHTMFGNMEALIEELYEEEFQVHINNYRDKGVCVYALDYLFDQIENNENKSFSVKISYLEIYNETVIDLLVPKSSALMIVEDSVKGVVVPDLTEYSVSNSKDLLKLMLEGNSRRMMAPTNQNQFSSRSHAILQVVVEQRNKTRDTREELLTSKFLIVDLAGSERGGLEKGLRSQEGANINKSLLSLGNCINLLSDKSKKGAFVPYRDSKLTRLLKDSLGGNISTVMIACVSPSPLTYDETVNTLKYATRARTIQKKITKNVKEVDVHISQYKEIIDSLKNEIDQLKEIIKNQQDVINDKNLSCDEKTISSSHSTPRLKVETGTNVNNICNYNNLSKVSKVGNHGAKNIHPGSSNNLTTDNIVDKSNDVIKSKISNKSVNYSDNSKKSLKQISDADYFNKTNPRSVHNVNLEVYKKCLDNVNVENMVLLDDEDKVNNNEIIQQTQHVDLEKQIDNLQTDKLILEEFIERSKIHDKSVYEKYRILKLFYQKYLELINEKLIENIEQNMILKFNMKEILDLNNTNNQHLSILFSQMTHLEKIKLNSQGNTESDDADILKIREEMNNIQEAINENERIKERIADSLKRNLKLKKILKKVLVKLITNTSHKDKLNNEKDVKYEQAYQNLIKEKEELESKNQKFQKHLSDLLKEKQTKDSKLTQVQKEVELLKKQLKEKDMKLKEIEKSKVVKSISITEQEKELALNDEDNRDISETFSTEVEHINLNLQDDYFNNKKKFISDINSKANEQNENAVQSIKYIINQTNNIVNNNINKIINKDKSKPPNSITPGNKSVHTIPHKTDDKKVTRKSQSKTRCEGVPNRARKLTTINNISTNSQLSENLLRMRSQTKSPKHEHAKKNKMKEFDKIIETQLNEVYNKKAKELGDKMKKKISVKSSTNSIMGSNRKESNNMVNNFNMILDKFNKMVEFIPTNENNNKDNDITKEINRSLSISRVSVNNEDDFHSELDIALNIPMNNNPKKCFNSRNENVSSKTDDLNKFMTSNANKLPCSSPAFKKMSSVIPTSTENSANKNLYVQKFLNNKDSSRLHSIGQSSSNANLHSFFNINSTSISKDKPVLPNKRDYSPGLRVLQQARLEKQLKLNCNVQDNATNSSVSNNKSHINVNSQSQISHNNNFANKFISKNTVDFLNEYSNNKKIIKNETDRSEDNFGEQFVLNTNRTELRKSELLEAAMTSLIKADSDANDQNQQVELSPQSKILITEEDYHKGNFCIYENDETEVRDAPLLLLHSPDELFKTLSEIKNPKISKFLDKN